MNQNTSTSHTPIPPDPAWISVPVGKAITAIVMFATVLLTIYTPIIIFGSLNISRQRSSFRDKLNLWISRMSCFAAGVFLSTGFLDIFPDVIRAIDEAGSKLKMKIVFPLASFFTLIGFFLILCIEQFILIYKNHINTIHPIVSKNKKNVSPINHEESQQAFLTEISENEISETATHLSNKAIELSHSKDSSLEDHEHFHREDDQNPQDHDEHSSILHHNKSRIFALMSAMSVHAVFEGLAIGLGTTIAGVAQLCIALSMHKLVIAASLGLSLATAELRLWVKIVVGLIFAFGSPLGIFFGMIIMSQEKGHDVFYMIGGVLEGLACGTFLYVVFFEILPHELGHHAHGDRGCKLTFLLLGFVLVCVYLLVVPS